MNKFERSTVAPLYISGPTIFKDGLGEKYFQCNCACPDSEDLSRDQINHAYVIGRVFFNIPTNVQLAV